MNSPDTETTIKAIDLTTQMFNACGVNLESPSRPAYIDFAVSSRRGGAKWTVDGESAQKILWLTESEHNSLNLEKTGGLLRARYVQIPKDRRNVDGAVVDELKGYTVASVSGANDQLTLSGTDEKGRAKSFTIDSSGHLVRKTG